MIHPFILCGGSGTRLWPLSRQSYPKQFVSLLGKESLYQATVRRLSGPGFAGPVAVASDQIRFIATRQMQEIGITPEATLIEPSARNTAPAVLAAALWLLARQDDPVMLVAPSDHVIPDAEGFRAAVTAALPAAWGGQIVTFGILPTRPETGYGYLELAPGADASANAPQPLARFVEKPNANRAAEMLADGNCLWNAGIFLFRARTIMEAFAAHAPEMLAPAQEAVSAATQDLGFTRFAAEPWAKFQDVSIDYAIMEKAKNLAVMPYRGHWSDLGSWAAVWQESKADESGNVLSEHALAISCRNTMLRSEAEGVELVGIGLEDLVAIAMPDAVLVARSSEAQRVKEVAAALKARGAKQAIDFPHERLPWGAFESLGTGARFHVKRIVIDPGARLSLQSHKCRAEHWIVVQGTARVTIDKTVTDLKENQSVYVPLGAIHRLENLGAEPLVLIEVQTGTYFGEDDIIRYEDVYARK